MTHLRQYQFLNSPKDMELYIYQKKSTKSLAIVIFNSRSLLCERYNVDQKDSGQFPEVDVVPNFYNATTKMHVERFIGRVLDWGIVDTVLPIYRADILSSASRKLYILSTWLAHLLYLKSTYMCLLNDCAHSNPHQNNISIMQKRVI